MSNCIGEIIIHGKPNSICHKATEGLDSHFVNTFTNEFSKESQSFKPVKSFIVEARLWKNVWYGVYTLMIKGVSDTANRGSFIALSIITPNNYFCLTSEVYNALLKVFNDYIIGNYLSKDWKFRVNDFGDEKLFNGLINRLSEGWANLQETFDSGFVPQANFPRDVFYNVADCDSKAFIQTLREKGRVIVSETAPSKDELLVNVQGLQEKIGRQSNEINDLKGKLGTYEHEQSESRKSKINLKKEKENLEKQNCRVNRQVQN